MRKTFLDSGVLISAWQSNTARQLKALTILRDPNREFVCSPFVRLELIPKATYFRKPFSLQSQNLARVGSGRNVDGGLARKCGNF